MDVYERLREVLDAHPSTAPKAKSIDEILRILFTPQEAAMAVFMSYKARKPSSIAQKAGFPEDEALRHLEMMAEKGIIFSRNKDGENLYGLAPLIRGRTQLKHQHAFEPSCFEALVQGEKCTGCTICADERCPMNAIEIINDIASVKPMECIGCGLCVTACPTGAIELKVRKQVPSIPPTVTEMGAKVLQEKGRLDAFLKIMQD